MLKIFVPILSGALLLAGCQSKAGSKGGQPQGKPAAAPSLTLSSPAFADTDTIPMRFTCDSANVSPALSWSGIPDATQSLALIVDDPDAPTKTWVHWVIYDLPPTDSALTEGIPTEPELEDGARQGVNDFGKYGYGGPCPPPGKPHRYYFKLYALDSVPELPDKATKQQLLDAMEGHVLAQAQLMGTYKRAE